MYKENDQAFMAYLKSEYELVMKMSKPDNDVYTVGPCPGEPVPYVRNYLLTYHRPTLVKLEDGTVGKQTDTVLRITLESGAEEPRARVEKGAVPFHPNWFASGLLPNGSLLPPGGRLVDYITRVCEVLCFEPSVINTASCANREANDYYLAHKDDPGMFPLDSRPVSVNAWLLYLKNEYKYTMRMNTPENDMYTIEACPGEPVPYVRNYLLTYHGPTLVKLEDGTVGKQTDTVLRITLNSRFEGPRTQVVRGTAPFHPNWFASGLLSNGMFWTDSSRLVDYIRYVCEMLQFKPDVIDVMSPSNWEAGQYFLTHKDAPGMFPVDSRLVPMPPKSSVRLRIIRKPEGNGGSAENNTKT